MVGPNNDFIQIMFVCDALGDHRPSDPLLDEISQNLIVPAVPGEYGFSIVKHSFRDEEVGVFNTHMLSLIQNSEILIVDLTSLSPAGEFIIRARDISRPTIYIVAGNNPVPFDKLSRTITYTRSDYSPDVPVLHYHIQAALDGREIYDMSPPSERPPRINRGEMASRIEATAEAIRSLRINSASEQIEELIAIAHGLREEPDDDNLSYLQIAAEKALKIIFSLMDELSTKQGARLTISGAIALIVGGTGVSGAAAFTAALAFWSGKEAYGKWLEKKGRASIERKKKPPKP